jgi:hypothetical protein
MTTQLRKFDCVEMKHQAQRRLRQEYETRSGEFATYEDFLNAKATESDWQRAFWEKIRKARESGK